MIKNNQLYYEDGQEIFMGDRLSVKLPDGSFMLVHLTEYPAGITQRIVNGQMIQEQQMAQGFIQIGTGQQISPQFLAECKLYEVIDVTGE